MKWGYPAKKINMDAAVSAMRDYCRANNLDESAIDGYQRSWAVVVAVRNKDIEPNGLCNDIASLPYVVLCYDADGVVHETENTHLIAAGDRYHLQAQRKETTQMRLFGFFKGMPYKSSKEDFDDYRQFRNTISRDAIIRHIESLSPAYACLESYDIFTGEELVAGLYIDGDFRFPYEFLHYYKNYDIGIPPDYEAYLKQIGVGRRHKRRQRSGRLTKRKGAHLNEHHGLPRRKRRKRRVTSPRRRRARHMDRRERECTGIRRLKIRADGRSG